MIVEYIRYVVALDRCASFEEAYAQAEDSFRASPHCLAWDLSRCVDEPTHYVLRIEWDSPEGHMEGFRKSSEFRTFFGLVRPYVDAIQEMRHYEQTNVVGRKEL